MQKPIRRKGEQKDNVEILQLILPYKLKFSGGYRAYKAAAGCHVNFIYMALIRPIKLIQNEMVTYAKAEAYLAYKYNTIILV